MLNIIVKNRLEILGGYIPNGDSILISISDFGDVIPVCASAYVDVLNLFFDDVDEPQDGVTVIGQQDATDIVKFIKDYPDIENIVVHCNAGQSRSAGCAAALSLILNGDDKPIIRIKPLYNRKVYREVLNEYYAN